MVGRRTATLVPVAIINPYLVARVKVNRLVASPAKCFAFAYQAVFETIEV